MASTRVVSRSPDERAAVGQERDAPGSLETGRDGVRPRADARACSASGCRARRRGPGTTARRCGSSAAASATAARARRGHPAARSTPRSGRARAARRAGARTGFTSTSLRSAGQPATRSSSSLVHGPGLLHLQEVRPAQLHEARPGDPLAGRAHVRRRGEDVVASRRRRRSARGCRPGTPGRGGRPPGRGACTTPPGWSGTPGPPARRRRCRRPAS